MVPYEGAKILDLSLAHLSKIMHLGKPHVSKTQGEEIALRF
jgi:hypothetical protein